MHIQSRETWKAAAPKRQARIALPTKELWLHHTAGNVNESVQSIQSFHMGPRPKGRGWSDIAYSFLVDQSGTVSVGRGAGVAGGHTKNRNTISHAICAIGNFETTEPSPQLIDSIASLVAHGILMGWWASGITGPHKEAPGAATACCGAKLIAHIPAINAKAASIIDELQRVPADEVINLADEPVVGTRWDPPFDITAVVDDLAAPQGGAWVLSRDGGVFAFGGAPFLGSAHKISDDWGDRRAARLEHHPDGGYTIVADTGQRYDFVPVHA